MSNRIKDLNAGGAVVATDVFGCDRISPDETFKVTGQAIGEMAAGFVSQGDFARGVNKQLAHLFAVADIDSRALQNSGKFYDLFDGENGFSQGSLNPASTKLISSLSASGTSLRPDNIDNFAQYQEITIQDGTNLERKTISSVGALSGTENSVSGLEYLNKFFDTLLVNPRALRLSTDGTKLYILDDSNVIHQYSLSTAFNISTATSDDKEFDVSTEENNAHGIELKTDGTKLYVLGDTGNDINQYSLSTAWDISTASTDSKVLSLAGEDTNPRSFSITPDGTTLYMGGNATTFMYQYDLVTPWDLSTGVFDSKSFNYTAQGSGCESIFINSDGSKMQLMISDDMWEYDLGTNYDCSTAVYNSQTYNLNTEDSAPIDVCYIDGGERMYMIGTTTDSIYQYKSATFEIIISTGVTNAYSVGALVYRSLIGTINSAGEMEFGGITKYELEALSYNSKSFSVASQEAQPYGFSLNNDGTKMYVTGTGGDDINQYILSTAYDVSTAGSPTLKALSDIGGNVYQHKWKSDGTILILLGVNSVWKYTASVAWDISTLTYSSSTSVLTGSDSAHGGLDVSPDGTKLWVCGANNDEMYEYSLATEWDVDSISLTKTFDHTPYTGNAANQGIKWNPDGSELWMFNTGSVDNYHFTASTAFDISTLSLIFSVPSEDPITSVYVYDIYFHPDGKRVWFMSGQNDTVYEYDCYSGFDLLTADLRMDISQISGNISEIVSWVMYTGLTGAAIDQYVSVVADAADESYVQATLTVSNVTDDLKESQGVHEPGTPNTNVTLRIMITRTSTDDEVNLQQILGAID